ncbi:MAG: hypothetical protein ACN6O6_22160 [Pseudomonas sp.]|uniref:hypothetical protein n=1 Tax=Pseudomonas sp. TaxID=306 RepID=UPI003D0E3896
MRHKLFIAGAALALLLAAQFSTAEESPSFVARTEALLQKNQPAAQPQAIADSNSTSKAQKTKDC